jgi:hypothetical protein
VKGGILPSGVVVELTQIDLPGVERRGPPSCGVDHPQRPLYRFEETAGAAGPPRGGSV